MTWSLKAAGHHSSNDWRAEEWDILEKAIAAVEVDNTVVSSFEFHGNHVSATTLAEAKAKLAEANAQDQLAG